MSSVPLPQTLAPAMLWVIFSLEGTLRDAAAGGGAASPTPPAAATPEGARTPSQDHATPRATVASTHRQPFPSPALLSSDIPFQTRSLPPTSTTQHRAHVNLRHYQSHGKSKVQKLKLQTPPDAACTIVLRHSLPDTFLATQSVSASLEQQLRPHHGNIPTTHSNRPINQSQPVTSPITYSLNQSAYSYRSEPSQSTIHPSLRAVS